MQEQHVTIINKLGLHARAAMELINLAGRFQSRVALRFKGREVDAKDIMEVMVLGAAKGAELDIITDGDDENDAMQAVVSLINNRFGEEE